MREIKFRAYISYGYTLQLGFIDTPDLIDFKNQRIKYDSEWYEKDVFKLMQSTGLQDKNGVEIFEGDVVKAVSFAKWIGVVKYLPEKAAFVLDEIEPSEYREPFIFLSQFQDGFEVLGNIYENADLLEVK